MSSNVPPYQVDLIVAAAVGHSVLSIFAIESQVQGRHGHPPCRSIKEIYDCLGPHYFRLQSSNDSSLFLLAALAWVASVLRRSAILIKYSTSSDSVRGFCLSHSNNFGVLRDFGGGLVLSPANGAKYVSQRRTTSLLRSGFNSLTFVGPYMGPICFWASCELNNFSNFCPQSTFNS